MRIRVQQVVVDLSCSGADVRAAAARRVRCRPEELTNVQIVRRSLDARNVRRRPVFVLTVEADWSGPQPPDGAEPAPPHERTPVPHVGRRNRSVRFSAWERPRLYRRDWMPSRTSRLASVAISDPGRRRREPPRRRGNGSGP